MSKRGEQILLGTLTAAHHALEEGQVGAQELTESALARIERLDNELHAFVTVDHEGALAAAARTEERLTRDGQLEPLDGIPVAVKDNIATAGLRTTFNSRTREHWRPTRDHPAVAALRACGAVIIGKTNLNELGWSVPAESDLTPPPRNPWRRSEQAIGSSSGSAVAVTVGMCLAALGTDGGGSTRLPASQMGLVGLKPTQWRVPFADEQPDSVSVVGVLARDTADAALVYDRLSANDQQHNEPVGTKLRIAIPRRQLDEITVDDEVRAAFEEDLATLIARGAELVKIDAPELAAAHDATFLLLAAQTHARFGELLRVDYARIGVSARRYLLSGAAVSVEDYLRARRLAEHIGRELERLLRIAACVALATPVSPVITTASARQPDAHNRGDNARFTSPFNAIGWPAISVPTHVGKLGIPFGLQLAAVPAMERRLLEIARLIEVPILPTVRTGPPAEHS